MLVRYDPVKDRFHTPTVEKEFFSNLTQNRPFCHEHPLSQSGELGQPNCYARNVFSREIAKRLWRKLFEEDPFDRRAAQAYRSKANGGRKAYEDLLREKQCANELVKTLFKEFYSNSGFGDAVTRKGTNLL